MLCCLKICAVAFTVFTSTTIYAQNANFGTPAEAKAMLERVIIPDEADPQRNGQPNQQG